MRGKMKKKYPWDKGLYIIAEAGVNHNGKFNLAKKMIIGAKKAGADAVKFQTWLKGELTGKFTKKIGYVKKNYNTKLSRYNISNKLSLTFVEFEKLKKFCDKIRIDFLTTPCGEKSLNFVSKRLKIKYIKIGSSELNNLEYLKKASKYNRPLIFSSGMGTFGEIKKAYHICKKNNKSPIIVFQCTSQYPCDPKNVNLNVIKSLKKSFPHVGFSDHTKGKEAAIGAIAIGVNIVEKHFTLNKNFNGPDHKASLNLQELKDYIKSLRTIKEMLGSYIKKPTREERDIMEQTRRGLVASRDIKKGTILKYSDILLKRPASGIQPNEFKYALNKKLRINLQKDQPIKKRYLK